MRNTRCSAIVSLIGDGKYFIKIYMLLILHLITILLWYEYLKSKSIIIAIIFIIKVKKDHFYQLK